MHAPGFTRFASASALAAALTLGFGSLVSADHAWGTYHWARTSSSFSLTIVNSTTTDWDQYVANAVGDWTRSTKLDMVQDLNGSTSDRDRRQCNAPSGMIRICNQQYGQTQWLGIAGISLDPAGHIVSGYTKLNDTYFSMAYYNKPDWKQSVACQELGHNIGLDHQDEDFNNTSLLSCMDYQDPPYEWANAHDFEQLEAMYSHTDTYNSYATSDGGSGGGPCRGKGCNKAGTPQGNAHEGWGRSLGRHGNHEKFERVDADGSRHITFVTWVDQHAH